MIPFTQHFGSQNPQAKKRDQWLLEGGHQGDGSLIFCWAGKAAGVTV